MSLLFFIKGFQLLGMVGLAFFFLLFLVASFAALIFGVPYSFWLSAFKRKKEEEPEESEEETPTGSS